MVQSNGYSFRVSGVTITTLEPDNLSYPDFATIVELYLADTPSIPQPEKNSQTCS